VIKARRQAGWLTRNAMIVCEENAPLDPAPRFNREDKAQMNGET